MSNQVKSITRIYVESRNEMSKLYSWTTDTNNKARFAFAEFLEANTDYSVENVIEKIRKSEEQGVDISSDMCSELTAVIHGDLNARNLVWSQDYLKYFLIDFERVRVGYNGADELRLAFALVSDLTEDAYLYEDLGSYAKPVLVKRLRDGMNDVIEDAENGIKYLSDFVDLVDKWASNPEDGRKSVAQNPRFVSETAIDIMLDNPVFSLPGTHSFWRFAIRMAAAKQLEYAMRGIDEMCFESDYLGDALRAKKGLNLYDYYSDEDLGEGKIDKHVLAKISRAIFAFIAAARVFT